MEIIDKKIEVVYMAEQFHHYSNFETIVITYKKRTVGIGFNLNIEEDLMDQDKKLIFDICERIITATRV